MSSENQKLSSFSQSITADSFGNTQTVSAPRLEATVSANLGNVSNLTITGGTSGQVLITNGSGGLSWANANSTVSTQAQPMLEFVVDSSGNNKTFSHPYIDSFVNNTYCEIFLNGVLQRFQDYTIVGNVLTMNTYLNVDDVVTVGITGLFDSTGNTGNVSGNTPPAGNTTEIQFNNNGVFGADSSLKYSISTLYTPSVNTSQISTMNTILPSDSNSSLGSVSQPWKEIYLSSNSVHLGNIVLSENNELLVDNNPVVTSVNGNVTVGNITATSFIGDGGNLTNLPVANISYVPLNGNTSQFLRGDGVFSVPSGGGSTSPAGNTTEIQFNSGGSFAASDLFTWNNNRLIVKSNSSSQFSRYSSFLPTLPSIVAVRGRGTTDSPLPANVNDECLVSYNFTVANDSNTIPTFGGFTGFRLDDPGVSGQFSDVTFIVRASEKSSNNVPIVAQMSSTKVSIGNGATATNANSIVLGSSSSTTEIGGNLLFKEALAEANTTATVQARLPVLINGVQYYLMLTQ